MRAIVLGGLVLVLLANHASARPPYKQGLKRYFGDALPAARHDCSTCHLTKEQTDDPASFEASAPPHNAFGRRLAELGDELRDKHEAADIPTRLRLIGQEDADGDGVANEIEILTGHAPGIRFDAPTADDQAALANVIAEFARLRDGYHWEPFQPVRRPDVPRARGDDWNTNPIDALVAREHEARGLVPRPEASRAVLLRRVSLDLIGLPPTVDELHDFLADSSPHAYEKVVERLLASPHYGERWGRHWMDVWRYSDWAGWTGGKQIRDSQPHIWRWRDWIVESLAADKPYDQMVTEMLAADELMPGDADALRATGFLVRNFKLLSREIWMQESVQHSMQAFVGLTVGCARCHDHMYDSISQEEYYQLRAIFEPYHVRLDRVASEPDTTKDGLARTYDSDLAVATYLFRKGDDRDPDKERPIQPGALKLLGGLPFDAKRISLPPAAYYPGLQPHVRRQFLSAAEIELKQAESDTREAIETLATAKAGAPQDATKVAVAGDRVAFAELSLAAARLKLASIQARIVADDARHATSPGPNVESLALNAAKSEREAAHAQAAADVAGAEAKRAAAMAAVKSDDAKTAQALAAAEKAVTEAVQKRDAAEKALAATSADYSPLTPIYPKESTGRRAALARWLTDRRNPLTARVAANQIWLRHFGRGLVPTVLDFGQNGQPPTHAALLDWLAAELMEPSFQAGPGAQPWSMKHLHRLIVASRTYRMASTPDDHNLAVDPDNRWLWRMPSRRMEAELVRDGVLYVAGSLDRTFGGPDIDYALGLSSNRRSIYFRHAQEKQMEFLKMFDCAAVTECYQRKESITPQQALALANSELTLVQSRVIARSLVGSTAADDALFARAAFERVLSRPPTDSEAAATLAFLTEQQQTLRAATDRVKTTGGSAEDTQKPSTDPALRARENLIHVLLNHNDFVTIR